MSKYVSPVYSRLIFMVLFLLSTSYSERISRMDLFDAAGNGLLFVTFEYDDNGKNTGRAVYTSDSTFLRRTVFIDHASGKRSREISFNFNDDTIGYTTFLTRNGRREISVFDEFNLDLFGAPVSYTASGENIYDMYHNGSVVYKMKYMHTPDGGLNRIEILDVKNIPLCYATVSPHTGTVRRPVRLSGSVPDISFYANRCRLMITLKKEAQLKVCVYNISGQLVAVPFIENMKPGIHNEAFHILPGGTKLAATLYIIRTYIDGTGSGSPRKFLSGMTGGGIR